VATRWRQIAEGKPRLTRKLIDSLPPPPRNGAIIFDGELSGFGLRVSAPSQRNPAGSRTWVLEYRPGGGGRNTPKRRFKIGTFEALSPDEARSIAREHLARILVDHADPAAKRSADRKRSALSDLREAYFATTDPYRKPRTRTMYAWLWSKYIEPELGSMRVDLIARSHVERMHRKIGERHAATASRTTSSCSTSGSGRTARS